MNATSDLIVPKELLNQLHMAPDEMLIELATHLYSAKRLTMGQAKRLANLDQISFQKELAIRDIYINLDWSDVEKDLENLKALRK